MSSTQLTGTAVLDRLRAIQRHKQALDVEELALIAQVETEGLAYDLGAKNTAVLLRDALHISARDAAGRVKLALAVTPGRCSPDRSSSRPTRRPRPRWPTG